MNSKSYNSDFIKEKILQFAERDDRIRAVLLEGSRANMMISQDCLQDFDVVFIVSDFDGFLKDDSWTDMFGEKIIEQQPEISSVGEKTENFYSYLILYKAGFRVDFSVIPVEFRHDFEESVRVVWLDKDGLHENLPKSSDRKYWVQKPSQQRFDEVCNEFWWVSTYVAKGLARNEITYAVKHYEEILRVMLMQVLDWKIGIENDFKVSTGKSGKFYSKYLDENIYREFLETYTDAELSRLWAALFKMTGLFSVTAKDVAQKMAFRYNTGEEENVLNYLHQVHSELRQK